MDTNTWISRLLQVTNMIPVLSEIDEYRDPKDNKFLALAFDAQANYLITGDKDLLVLNPWRKKKIVSPADFVALDYLQNKNVFNVYYINHYHNLCI